jgi:predicted ATP-dependent serine protease
MFSFRKTTESTEQKRIPFHCVECAAEVEKPMTYCDRCYEAKSFYTIPAEPQWMQRIKNPGKMGVSPRFDGILTRDYTGQDRTAL